MGKNIKLITKLAGTAIVFIGLTMPAIAIMPDDGAGKTVPGTINPKGIMPDNGAGKTRPGKTIPGKINPKGIMPDDGAGKGGKYKFKKPPQKSQPSLKPKAGSGKKTFDPVPLHKP